MAVPPGTVAVPQGCCDRERSWPAAEPGQPGPTSRSGTSFLGLTLLPSPGTSGWGIRELCVLAHIVSSFCCWKRKSPLLTMRMTPLLLVLYAYCLKGLSCWPQYPLLNGVFLGALLPCLFLSSFQGPLGWVCWSEVGLTLKDGSKCVMLLNKELFVSY